MNFGKRWSYDTYNWNFEILYVVIWSCTFIEKEKSRILYAMQFCVGIWSPRVIKSRITFIGFHSWSWALSTHTILCMTSSWIWSKLQIGKIGFKEVVKMNFEKRSFILGSEVNISFQHHLDHLGTHLHYHLLIIQGRQMIGLKEENEQP